MPRNKSKTNNKVQNSKVEFKNGKNELAESLIKHSFEPLFSPKDGKARLTFCGVEHTIIEWVQNGKKKEKPVMKLVFSCLDITHDQPANIAITCDYRISERNRLGQIAEMMGYDFQKETVVVDEDDEFGVQTKHSNAREIFDFFRDKCGLVFKGNLTVAIRKNKLGERVERPGLWDIDHKTLEPMIKKGEQLRDMLASDISDEDFVTPQIDMEGDAD